MDKEHTSLCPVETDELDDWYSLLVPTNVFELPVSIRRESCSKSVSNLFTHY